jgi:hypothetical protein
MSPPRNKPFDPKDGIRAALPADDTELRASLKQFGWSEHLPAIADERGSVLIGHRRLKIAQEEGITPVIKTIAFGDGDGADAERVKLAIISNIGHKPLTPKDRQHIAKYLYGDKQWTMQRIGQALNVSARTVSEDLRGFEAPSKPPRPKGGRPKGSGVRRMIRRENSASFRTDRKPKPRSRTRPAVKSAFAQVTVLGQQTPAEVEDHVGGFDGPTEFWNRAIRTYASEAAAFASEANERKLSKFYGADVATLKVDDDAVRLAIEAADEWTDLALRLKDRVREQAGEDPEQDTTLNCEACSKDRIDDAELLLITFGVKWKHQALCENCLAEGLRIARDARRAREAKAIGWQTPIITEISWKDAALLLAGEAA